MNKLTKKQRVYLAMGSCLLIALAMAPAGYVKAGWPGVFAVMLASWLGFVLGLYWGETS